MATDEKAAPKEYEGASGGWGSLKGIGGIELRERAGPGVTI